MPQTTPSFINYGIGSRHRDYRNPEESPEGTVPAPQLTEKQIAQNHQLVENYAEDLYHSSAQEILQWAHQHVPGPLAVTLSMENTVLAELAATYLPDADFLFLDTGYHFPETLEVAEKVRQRYPQSLVVAKPLLNTVEQDATYGKDLFTSNPTACCRMRKVEPLAASMGPYTGWITGLRRADSPLRAQTPALDIDANGRLKISPLVTWSLEETQQFIEEKDLIIHPLTLVGYPSIGCAPCTARVEEGQDPRSGRWAGFTKTECGLHT